MSESDHKRSTRNNPGNTQLIAIAAIVILVVIGGIWYFNQPQAPEPVEVTSPEPEPVQPEPQPQPAPDIPWVEMTERRQAPLPPLAESDPMVKQQLRTLSDDENFERWVNTDNIIQKGVALLESASKGELLRNALPVPTPPGNFEVRKDGDKLYIDQDNYRRYEPLVNTVISLDGDSLANSFHRFRPLFEEAYSEMGQDPEQVDNRLVGAIDRILATPEVDGPIELVQESVHYQFADPELEALPPVQKLMLRMGPDNRQKLKEHLRALRAELLNPDSDR